MAAMNRGIELDISRGDGWAARVTASLWPKSKEKSDPVVMFNEWVWNRARAPHGEGRVLPCDLCHHPETYYKFWIRNVVTGQNHSCGSVCILRFLDRCNNITGSTYNVEAEMKIMQEMIRQEQENDRRNKLITAISEAHVGDDFKQSMLDIHTSKKYKVAKVSPKQAIYLASGIPTEIASELVINLRPRKYMQDAIKELDKIRYILKPAQLASVESRISKI